MTGLCDPVEKEKDLPRESEKGRSSHLETKRVLSPALTLKSSREKRETCGSGLRGKKKFPTTGKKPFLSTRRERKPPSLPERGRKNVLRRQRAGGNGAKKWGRCVGMSVFTHVKKKLVVLVGRVTEREDLKERDPVIGGKGKKKVSFNVNPPVRKDENRPLALLSKKAFISSHKRGKRTEKKEQKERAAGTNKGTLTGKNETSTQGNRPQRQRPPPPPAQREKARSGLASKRPTGHGLQKKMNSVRGAGLYPMRPHGKKKTATVSGIKKEKSDRDRAALCIKKEKGDSARERKARPSIPSSGRRATRKNEGRGEAFIWKRGWQRPGRVREKKEQPVVRENRWTQIRIPL